MGLYWVLSKGRRGRRRRRRRRRSRRSRRRRRRKRRGRGGGERREARKEEKEGRKEGKGRKTCKYMNLFHEIVGILPAFGPWWSKIVSVYFVIFNDVQTFPRSSPYFLHQHPFLLFLALLKLKTLSKGNVARFYITHTHTHTLLSSSNILAAT